jgi:hypothetical protein
VAYRAKSVDVVDHPAAHKVQRKALKALKRSKLQARLDDLVDTITPYVAQEMKLDPKAAQRQAKRWVLEVVAEAVYQSLGDVIFLE